VCVQIFVGKRDVSNSGNVIIDLMNCRSDLL
jgi:hypothetical protein